MHGFTAAGLPPARPPTLVFPAEAGIQRRAGWIPAFAGMTSFAASHLRDARLGGWVGRARGERGFSLIETVIALGVLGVIGIAFLTALTTSSKATGSLSDGVQAEALIRSHLETIKECDYADNADYYDEDACPSLAGITVPFQFTVVIDIDCSTDGGFDNWTAPCPGETFQRITVGVSRESRPVLSMTTFKKK